MDLAAAAAQAAANYYASAVADTSSSSLEGISLTLPESSQQQQGLADSSSGLGPADLLLWRWLACLKLEAAARQAVGQVAPLAGSGELQQDFQVGLLFVFSFPLLLGFRGLWVCGLGLTRLAMWVEGSRAVGSGELQQDFQVNCA
jgi:hypothetical protein